MRHRVRTLLDYVALAITLGCATYYLTQAERRATLYRERTPTAPSHGPCPSPRIAP